MTGRADLAIDLDYLAAQEALTETAGISFLASVAAKLEGRSTADFLREAELLETVQGYFHDNGFLKLEILRSSMGTVRLRIHIWGLNPEPRFHQKIHNHSFDFASYILNGRLLKREYLAVSNGGKKLFTYLYHRSIRGSSNYSLIPNGSLKVARTSEELLSPGDTYFMKGDTFHTLDPEPPGRAMSLVVVRAHEGKDPALVLFESNGAHHVDRNCKPIGVSEILSLLDRFEREDAVGDR